MLPYRTATQSGIVGIAYHFDLPVIVTDVGGLAEMVEENKTGLIIGKSGSADLTEAISTYFNDNLVSKFVPFIAEYKTQNSWNGLADVITRLSTKL
ncbi:MAG TPA: hypothetical protein DCX92_11340 [Bacteroidetes bacterium]|nr:hypothetical protein [Bacteroidota bacterium]